MCTVTFVPRRTGYYLAMNRDERLTRDQGLPPAERIINGRIVLCPSESSGGTWIALNDSRTSFALINGYSAAAQIKELPVSRGKVVTAVCATTSPEAAGAELMRLPLARINPFRLIGVFPKSREITEWQWDLNTIARKSHGWKPQQWISSGFDEPAAQRIRDETFQEAQRQCSAGTLGWLRRLHRSHSPESGPFSTCMHRSDAATVSYTEINTTVGKTIMGYKGISPCHGRSACSDF